MGDLHDDVLACIGQTPMLPLRRIVPDQLQNRDQIPAYHRMADEIWRQAGARVDAFVQCVGTALCRRERRGPLMIANCQSGDSFCDC
jgi:hypothetical protein